MSSFLSTLRTILGNRRRASRRPVSVPVSVSVLSSIARNARWPTPLAGHTRDLSLTHLAVVVPSIRIGSRYLTARDSRLLIALDLADETVEIEGSPVRYDKITGGGESGHLIVAKIRRISENRREFYADYLRSLG